MAGAAGRRRGAAREADGLIADTQNGDEPQSQQAAWYGQVGAFVALSLAGAGAFWNFYAQPAQASIDSGAASSRTAAPEIDRGLATARRLPEFRQEVADARSAARAAARRAAGGAGRRRSAAPRQAMATQSNLTIRGFTPQAVAQEGSCTRNGRSGCSSKAPITTSGRSSSASASSRGSSTSATSRSRRARAQTGGATVTAECTATTFVLLDPASRRLPQRQGRAAAQRAAAGGRRS